MVPGLFHNLKSIGAALVMVMLSGCAGNAELDFGSYGLAAEYESNPTPTPDPTLFSMELMVPAVASTDLEKTFYLFGYCSSVNGVNWGDDSALENLTVSAGMVSATHIYNAGTNPVATINSANCSSLNLYQDSTSKVKIRKIWGIGNISNISDFTANDVGLTEFHINTLPVNLIALYLVGNHLTHTNQVQILQAFDSHGTFASGSNPVLAISNQQSLVEANTLLPLDPNIDACIVQRLLNRNVAVYGTWVMSGAPITQDAALGFCIEP